MKNFILFIALIMIAMSAPRGLRASDESDRRDKILSIIDEELGEVTRLNKQIKSSDPTLLLKMGELLLEKARLIKESENERYLAVEPAKRSEINKKEFFKDSNAYFIQAQKTCFFLLKRFPNFKEKGEVFYILAFNAKEFQDLAKAEKFFELAIKYTKPNSTASKRAKLSLAEIYYNNLEYEKAKKLYEGSLDKSDKWWTKDAFNLAWCYFRLKQESRGIELMNEVHKKSQDIHYVDISSSVERDLAYFYTATGSSDKAIGFYKQNNRDVGDNLVKVAEHLLNQGKFSQAEQAYAEALNYATTPQNQATVHIALLNLYDKFGKDEKHLISAQKLFELHKSGQLRPDQVENLKYHVQTKSAVLQKQVAGTTYNRLPEIRKSKANMAVAYFKIDLELNPGRSTSTLFLAAETMYAAELYNQAVVLYDEASKIAYEKKDKKYYALSIDGMIASLGQKSISKEIESKYLTTAYRKFLIKSPTSEKSFKVYQRLFSTYYDGKQYDEAEKVLLAFSKNFPNSIDHREVMLGKLLDHYKKAGDKQSLARWNGVISKGEFNVTEKFLDKMKMVLMAMQFEEVEKASTKGDKTQALKLYLKIYKDPESNDAKKNAAYNLSTYFYELGNPALTYGWIKRALDHMDSKDVLGFEESFLAMSTDLFNRRRFSEAHDVFDKVLTKICQEKTSKTKDVFFKNSMAVLLSNNKPYEVEKLIAKGKGCGVSDSAIDRSRLDFIASLSEGGNLELLEKTLEVYEIEKKFWPDMIYPLSVLEREYRARNNQSKATQLREKIYNYYNDVKKRNENIPLQGLDTVAFYQMGSLRDMQKDLFSTKLEFPETKFNATLKQKFGQLDKLTDQSIKIMKLGSGAGISAAYKIMIQSYDKFIAEILTFIPSGKSADYLSSFKQSMNQLVQPLQNKSAEYKTEAKKKINDFEILSEDNLWFMYPINKSFEVEYYPANSGLLMDKRGKI